MGHTEDLLTGLARDLQAAGIGKWSPAGTYGSNDIGIVLGRFPDKPNNVITLSPYGVDDVIEGEDTIGVQVRSRRAGLDPRPGMLTADQIFDRWHARHDFLLPNGLHVTQMTRRSWVSGGIDSSDRSTVIQNFYVQLVRPSQHRP
jgi:hypothetical protein